MSDSTEVPSDEDAPSTLGSLQDKEVRLRIPANWHSALQEAAHEMGISITHLTRLLYRQFLRNRYTPEQRAELEKKGEIWESK